MISNGVKRSAKPCLPGLTIQSQLSKDLQEVTDSDEARALQQDGQKQMLTAVESNGLTVQDYNEVVQAMQQNMELRDEVLAQLRIRKGCCWILRSV